MAEIGLDGSGFEAGLKRAEGLAHGVAEGLKSFAIQAIGVLTVEQAIAKTVETAKELVETSKRLAIAPEQLQVMRQAAKDAGIELGDVAKFIEKIDIAREKSLLRQGVEPMQMRRTFGALGVTQDQLRTMTGAQLMMGPISQAAQNRNPEELGALFRSLGLREFGQMIPVLKTNFGELEKEMRKFGGIMDTETIVSLKMASEEFGLLTTLVISHLAPALIALTEIIYKSIAGWSAFISFIQGALSKVTSKDASGSGSWWAGPLAPFIAAFNIGKKLDLGAGKESAIQSVSKWSDALEAVKKKIREDADKLRHPTPASFDTSSLPEKITSKALEVHSDSLTKVGNFLGGMGIAGQIEQRKVELLTRIAVACEDFSQAKSGASVYEPNTEGPIVKGPFRMLSGTNFPH